MKESVVESPQHSGDPTSSTENTSWAHRILRRFSGKTIYIFDRKYLTRYYLIGDGSGRGMELYIHNMHDIDRFRLLHNHPWPWFLSLILWGSYEQESYHCTSKRRRRQNIRWFNLFRGYNKYHSVRDLPKGEAWTLVLVPPKSKSRRWGYWDEKQQCHVPDDVIGHESAHIETFGKKVLMD